MMGRRKLGLPGGWLGCPKIGSGLVDNIFLAFKTPLKVELNQTVDKDKRWFPQDIFQEFKKLNKKTVLWVDLTNTDRYYHSKQVEDEGFEYLKLQMEGHGKPPTLEHRRQFSTRCDNFLKKNPDGLIAVHCTHGFNRTGYLICNYLMFRRNFNAHTAITEFSKHRAPGIYRQNYVDDLYQTWKSNKTILGVDPGFDLPPQPEVVSPPWEKEKKSESPKSWRDRDSNFKVLGQFPHAHDRNGHWDWRERDREDTHDQYEWRNQNDYSRRHDDRKSRYRPYESDRRDRPRRYQSDSDSYSRNSRYNYNNYSRDQYRNPDFQRTGPGTNYVPPLGPFLHRFLPPPQLPPTYFQGFQNFLPPPPYNNFNPQHFLSVPPPPLSSTIGSNNEYEDDEHVSNSNSRRSIGFCESRSKNE